MEATTPDITTRHTCRVLVVGDDGRLAGLLPQTQALATFEPRTFDALVRLDRESYDAVLLHAEGLAHRTSDAVRAIRDLQPNLRILLYGDPFTEIYCRPALEAGADDYLISPIPADELGQVLRQLSMTGPEPSARFTPNLSNAAASTAPSTTDQSRQILALYRDLASLIPHGRERLIEQAQRDLAPLLGAEWVEILPADRQESDALELTGPLGPVGRLRLGPTIPTPPIAPEDVAGFLATLLYLAQRDVSLKQLATIDELTGACNRRYLEYFLRQVIDESTDQSDGPEVSLLIFDIDDFKHYNDTYGHIAGDKILKEATHLMRRCCRSHDVVARMGGDEFAVLFWDAGGRRPAPSVAEDERRGAPGRQPQHPDIAVFLSNRFRRMMKTSEFSVLGPEARGRLAISGGLASFPRDGQTVEDLLARADEALLNAKRSGKDCIYLVGQP